MAKRCFCSGHPASAKRISPWQLDGPLSWRGTRSRSSPRKPSSAQLAKAHAENKLDDRLTFFWKPKLLIVDEFGYLPFEPNAAHLFFQLVSRRYERGSMLITSNRSIGEWGTVFGDAVVATAILDRLLHHSHVITIRDGF